MILLSGIGLWRMSPERRRNAGISVVNALPTRAAHVVATPVQTDPARVALALPALIVLETETADDVSAGSATVQTADGRIERIGVGRWIDRRTRLSGVSDANALVDFDGRPYALAVRESLDKADSHGSDTAMGIDFGHLGNHANPAMARR